MITGRAQSGMVTANLDSESMMGPERGSETEDLYIRLLLSNASREQIREKLVQLADYYIAKANS